MPSRHAAQTIPIPHLRKRNGDRAVFSQQGAGSTRVANARGTAAYFRPVRAIHTPPVMVQALPARFDASAMTVKQRFTTSKGTKR
jgi:prolyl oligopeptidase PreP (S9A serine peptidase family)